MQCGVFMVLNFVLLVRSQYPAHRSGSIRDGDEFEFVVVGAGAAGAALAGRLAGRGAAVLLLDAGGDPPLKSMVPALAPLNFRSETDWSYETISNGKSCLGQDDGACNYAAGRLLGGGTAINYMLYARGNRRDFDEWGVPGWRSRDIAPYFLRAEGLRDARALPLSSWPYHGVDGPVMLEFFRRTSSPWPERLVAAYGELGVPFNPDVNGRTQLGITRSLGYVYGGERQSTARAYLAPLVWRDNLVVVKRARVDRVIIDEGRTARGVVVRLMNGRRVRLYAEKEVILSAGAIGTPRLLLLSGVGPAEQLLRVNVTVKVDLPAVGDCLQDHVLALYLVRVPVTGPLGPLDPLPILQVGSDVLRSLSNASNPLSNIDITDHTAFINSQCLMLGSRAIGIHECDLPDLQIIHARLPRGAATPARSILADASGLRSDILDQIEAINVDSELLLFAPVVLRPSSRGRVELRSSNPDEPVALHAEYLQEESDAAALVRGVNFVKWLMETRGFRRLNASLVRLDLKECEGREYWLCYGRVMTGSVFHGVGSAALGRVVDAALRVRSVRGLRVADASILPLLPRGNTAAASIAVGERAADIISDEWGY